MKRRFTLFFTIVFLASFYACSSPIILKYTLKPGEVQVYKAAIDFRSDVVASDSKQKEAAKVSANIKIWIIMECISSEENEATCECRFFSPEVDFDMTASGVQVKVQMDTTGVKTFKGDKQISSVQWSEFKDPSMPNLAELIKTRIRFRVARNGEMLGFINGEDLKKKFPGFEFEKMLGENVVYPSHPIDIGDSWQATIETELDAGIGSSFDAGRLKNVFKYTLKEIKEYNGTNCAIIDVTGISAQAAKDSPLGIKQDVKGTTIVEIETGKIIEANAGLIQQIKGKVSGADLKADSSGKITVRYAGGQIPKEVLEQDMLARIDPVLLKALNAIRVPMVLDDKVMISGELYVTNDAIKCNGVDLRLLKFSEDRIYLKDDDTGIIYKIVLNFKGEVTGIKPLFNKEG